MLQDKKDVVVQLEKVCIVQLRSHNVQENIIIFSLQSLPT